VIFSKHSASRGAQPCDAGIPDAGSAQRRGSKSPGWTQRAS